MNRNISVELWMINLTSSIDWNKYALAGVVASYVNIVAHFVSAVVLQLEMRGACNTTSVVSSITLRYIGMVAIWI